MCVELSITWGFPWALKLLIRCKQSVDKGRAIDVVHLAILLWFISFDNLCVVIDKFSTQAVQSSINVFHTAHYDEIEILHSYSSSICVEMSISGLISL